MIRNRELFYYFLAQALVAGVVTGLVSLWAPQAVPAFLFGFLLLIAISMGFQRLRYRQIAQLNDYLQQVATGDFSLDIQDHKEGEMGLLRTEIYKVVLRLSEQRDIIHRERQALSDAISNISHQLKTPITSMLMMTDLLRQEELEKEKRQEFARSIGSQLQRTQWLVSSLLKLAKVDGGAIRFQKKPEAVGSLLRQALEPIQIPLDIKGIDVKITGDTSALLLCDRQWTVEAFLNVLKNCMEHTPEGGQIQVQVQDNPLYTQLVILDSGEGIPRAEVPYVFQRFYRGQNAAADSVGIGLAMTRSFLNGQNGDITALPGPGGHFVIRFYHQEAV